MEAVQLMWTWDTKACALRLLIKSPTLEGWTGRWTACEEKFQVRLLATNLKVLALHLNHLSMQPFTFKKHDLQNMISLELKIHNTNNNFYQPLSFFIAFTDF